MRSIVELIYNILVLREDISKLRYTILLTKDSDDVLGDSKATQHEQAQSLVALHCADVREQWQSQFSALLTRTSFSI